MTKKRVLFLDDAPWRHKLVRAKMEGPDSAFEVVHVWTVDECIEAIQTKGPFDLIYLDHDLNDYIDKTGKFSKYSGMYGDQRLNGTHVTNWMVRNMPDRPEVIVHSWNHSGAQSMVSQLTQSGFYTKWELFNGACGPNDEDYEGPDDTMEGWKDCQ